MQVEPYLFFDGLCEEAIEFYRRTLGAEVTMLMRWKDCPEQPTNKDMLPPGSENKVMHARLRIGQAAVMASDGRCTGKPSFQGFALSLDVANEAEADVVGVSALMTTSMPRMRELLRLADDRKVRKQVRFIVGGAPVTDEFSTKIGADGTAPDAAEAVHLVRRLLGGDAPADSR